MNQGRIRFDAGALREVLRRRGWTPYRLAAEIGVDRAYAYRVVSGAVEPGRKFLLGLAGCGIELGEVTTAEPQTQAHA